MKIEHLDVKTAFLNGDLKERVLMEIPEGFGNEGNKGKVCLLKKALYGLKQSPRAWYEKINDTLLNIGLKKSKYEPCVYYDGEKNSESLLIVALFVDDLFVFSKSEEKRKKLKETLISKFEMTDLGLAKNMLGIRVTQTKEGITWDQKAYVEKLLSKFNMTDCKPVATPLEGKLSCGEASEDLDVPYQELIGSLMYLSVCTRPDICHTLSYLSQFNKSHGIEHWKAAKRVLRYLKGSLDFKLKFEKTGKPIYGFVDSDWASDEDRKSYTGYVFKFGGSAVSWESRKQSLVALSSTEAEYIGLTEAAKEATFLRNFLGEYVEFQEPMILYNDNQSAQKLSSNPVFHKRTKHIDIKYHFVREVLQNGVVKIEYLPTEEMVADILTKPLCRVKHLKFCKLMMVSD